MRRPSPALVLAFIALIVALSGTGYAAKKITSADIKNRSIKAADIAPNAIRSIHIKNGQVKSADIKNKGIKPADLGTGVNAGPGAPGPAGAPGGKGDQGPAGADGLVGLFALSDGFATSFDRSIPGEFISTSFTEVRRLQSEFLPFAKYLSMAFVNVEGQGRVTCGFSGRSAEGGLSLPDQFVADLGSFSLPGGGPFDAPTRYSTTLVSVINPREVGAAPFFVLSCKNDSNSAAPARISGRIVTVEI